MSEATAPITHRRVLKIAVPIVLSNATVPILGAVDTGVVGQLGEAAPIGAVGIGAIIIPGVVVEAGTSGQYPSENRGSVRIGGQRSQLIGGANIPQETRCPVSIYHQTLTRR